MSPFRGKNSSGATKLHFYIFGAKSLFVPVRGSGDNTSAYDRWILPSTLRHHQQRHLNIDIYSSERRQCQLSIISIDIDQRQWYLGRSTATDTILSTCSSEDFRDRFQDSEYSSSDTKLSQSILLQNCLNRLLQNCLNRSWYKIVSIICYKIVSIEWCKIVSINCYKIVSIEWYKIVSIVSPDIKLPQYLISDSRYITTASTVYWQQSRTE